MRPVVRYMLVCEDWEADPGRELRLSVFGLVTNLISGDEPPFPMTHPQLCILLVLTECYRPGQFQIVCVSEEHGGRVFANPERVVNLPADPLRVHGVSFRIRDCVFPGPGFYSIQLLHDGVLVEERPIHVR